MKFVALETGTSEVAKYGDTLRKLGHEVASIRYDIPGLADQTLIAKIREQSPQCVVYIGSRWGIVPSPACLSRINEKIAPSVLICSDAGDAPWHDMLRQYDQSGCFTLHVAIDGSTKWPGSDHHMTALTPVDSADYLTPPRPHALRNVIAGFAGNAGGGGASVRTNTLTQLLSTASIEVRTRSPLPFTYKGYADYLCNVRISLNVAQTGTEASMHVKGRIVESGWAGCCVLESKGSPTASWFTPGTDYLEYGSATEAAQMIAELRENPMLTESYGLALRAKIEAEHTIEKFWTRVFERMGIGEKQHAGTAA